MRERWVLLLLCALLVQLSGCGYREDEDRLNTTSPDSAAENDFYGMDFGNGSESTSGMKKTRRVRSTVEEDMETEVTTIGPIKIDCAINSPLISNCDKQNPGPVECEEITAFSVETLLCPSDKNLYIKQDDGTWKPEKDVKCDPDTGNWMMESFWKDWSRPMKSGENVVCGVKPGPCELCPNLYPVVRYSAAEFYFGSPTVPGSDPDTPCRKLTCPADHYLTTNLAKTKFEYDEDIHEIKCNNETKWTTKRFSFEEEITSAVCIKKVSCHLTTPLKSECSGLEAWECEKIVFNDDTPKSCGDNQKMFIKGDAETTWTGEYYNFVCDFARGVWKHGEDDMKANDQVICAVANPSLPSPAPCELCRPLAQADCDSTTGCEVGGSIIEHGRLYDKKEITCKTLTCPIGEFFITDKGISIQGLTCNDEKKWMTNKQRVVEKAACIKRISCIVKTPLKSDCNGLDDWGCVKVDFTSNSEKSCAVSKSMFFKDVSGTTWEYTTSLYCDEILGVWQRGPEGHQADMQANDQVICADSNPSQPALDSCELCPPLPLQECDSAQGCEQGGQIIEQTSTEMPPCKTLKCPDGEFLLTNLWKDGDQENRLMQRKIHEIRCDSERKWMTVGMDEERSVESAVCIKEFSCHISTRLKSDCTGLDDWGCEEFNLNGHTSFCWGIKSMFFKTNDDTAWSEISNISCDLKRGVWTRWSNGYVDIPYDGQVICAVSNPSDNEPPPVPCQLCPALTQADCDSAKGCESGRRIHEYTDWTTQCEKMTCLNFGEFIITDQGVYRELTCNNEKKWTTNGRIVEQAACIKKIFCRIKTPLKSDCTGLDDWGCVKVDFTEDDINICEPHKAMFFKNAAGTIWEETTSLYCNEMLGIWKRGPEGHHVDMQANDQVICADSNPSQPALDPCFVCPPLAPIDCDIATGCEVGEPIIMGSVEGTPACKKLTCPDNDFLITDLASAINAAESVSEINCDSEKKWMTVGLSQELEVSGAVCIKKLSCAVITPLKSNCTALDAWGCAKIDVTKDDSKNCEGTKTMYSKSDAALTWNVATTLVCDLRRGVWKQGPDGQQVDMQSGDQVICADSDPSPAPCELCPPIAPIDCDDATGCEIGGPIIEGIVAGTPACKKLTCDFNEHLITNLGYSKKALTCNDQKTWIMKGKVVEKAVCIKKFSCIVKTPLKSDCSGLDDWGCVKVDLSNNEDKICDSSKNMFFKTASGTTWEDATSLVCDEASGVWRRGPEDDQVNMHSNEQVICSDSNPSEPPSGTAQRFKRHY